jgi:hypothetical protein
MIAPVHAWGRKKNDQPSHNQYVKLASTDRWTFLAAQL